MLCSVRCPTKGALDVLREKVSRCFETAACATGCKVLYSVSVFVNWRHGVFNWSRSKTSRCAPAVPGYPLNQFITFIYIAPSNKSKTDLINVHAACLQSPVIELNTSEWPWASTCMCDHKFCHEFVNMAGWRGMDDRKRLPKCHK